MSDRDAATRFAVTLRFHGDLTFFLKRAARSAVVIRSLGEKTSVKDVIESCGVPHPEVDLILCDGVPSGFGFHVMRDTDLDVYPVAAPPEFHPSHRLQTRHLTRFVVDGHLGKLARDLRLLGFDTLYRNHADDAWLVATAVEQERALLSRDRRLLMHAVLRDGYCPRSPFVEEQIVEVAVRFRLRSSMQPYTRCLRCNGALIPADKGAVIGELEPLTKIYYADFRRCQECGQVYWAGSHFRKLQARIERIRFRVDRGSESEAGGEKWA